MSDIWSLKSVWKIFGKFRKKNFHLLGEISQNIFGKFLWKIDGRKISKGATRLRYYFSKSWVEKKVKLKVKNLLSIHKKFLDIHKKFVTKCFLISRKEKKLLTDLKKNFSFFFDKSEKKMKNETRKFISCPGFFSQWPLGRTLRDK